MRITIITGSGRVHGTSNYLAENFARGAKEAGAKVFRFNAALERLLPCTGCNSCRSNGGCVINDSFNSLLPEVLEADLIVWVTPVYYMTMTASIKLVIDRFYQLETNPDFIGRKKYIVISTAWDSNPSVFDILIKTFESFSRFLKWEKVGQILAGGMDTREQIENSNYGEIAYELGKAQTTTS